jgi:hypothetical protein
MLTGGDDLIADLDYLENMPSRASARRVFDYPGARWAIKCLTYNMSFILAVILAVAAMLNSNHNQSVELLRFAIGLLGLGVLVVAGLHGLDRIMRALGFAPAHNSK